MQILDELRQIFRKKQNWDKHRHIKKKKTVLKNVQGNSLRNLKFWKMYRQISQQIKNVEKWCGIKKTQSIAKCAGQIPKNRKILKNVQASFEKDEKCWKCTGKIFETQNFEKLTCKEPRTPLMEKWSLSDFVGKKHVVDLKKSFNFVQGSKTIVWEV